MGHCCRDISGSGVFVGSRNQPRLPFPDFSPDGQLVSPLASGARAGRQPQPCPSDTSTNWACWRGGGQLGQVPVALSSPPHASALGKPTPMGLRSPQEGMGGFLHCPMTDIEQCSAPPLYVLGESYT